MSVCENCVREYVWNGGDNPIPGECKDCQVMDGKPTNFKPKPKTNADRIRAMSDEELSEVLGKLVHCGGCPMRDNCKVDNLPCSNVLIEWLKQPAEVDNG